MRLRSGRLLKKRTHGKTRRKALITKVDNTAFGNRYQRITHIEEHPSCLGLVEEGQGASCKRMIASIIWRRFEMDQNQHKAYIESISVDARWQRMHLATFLVYCCLKKLKELDVKTVELHDHTKHQIGKSLYLGNGFQLKPGSWQPGHLSGSVDVLLSNLKEKLAQCQMPGFPTFKKPGPCNWLLHTFC